VIGGRYTLRTAIGHGGMGTVWRASDTVLRRDVAVKEVLLPPGLAPTDRESMYQRTLREARAAAALSHPAVVQVYDVVTDGGRPWIVMELLQSRSLADLIVEDGPLASRAVAKIGVALLGALEVAHAAGVLHRDVKPANVLIASDGRCVLTDFGVARMPTDAELTSPGMVLGSPHFISPERAVGASFGPPSDLFSLGVTLYTAVEGRPPFDKPDPFETMRAVVEEPPTPAIRAGALAGVLYGLLEKDPQRRWNVGTARQVLRELLVGPLASNPTGQFTDPYAVVKPKPFTPSPAATAPGQIGGKAMIRPGETVTGAVRRRASSAQSDADVAVETRSRGAGTAGMAGGPDTGSPPAPAQRRPSDLDATDAAGVAVTGFHVDVLPIGGPGPRASHAPPQSPVSPGPHSAATTTRLPRATGRHAAPDPFPRTRRAGLTGVMDAAGSARTAVIGLRERARPHADRGIQAMREAPSWVHIAGAVAIAVALLAAVLGLAALFGDGDRRAGRSVAAQPVPSAPATFEVQEHLDPRGFAVNVPRGWQKRAANTYVDYLDPANAERRVRVNVEDWRSSHGRFAEVAEDYLETHPAVCEAPYARVALRTDVKLADQPAAEWEYTCGSGDRLRHGIWRALAQNGKAYVFYLSTPDSQFAASKPIYDEMVRSYRLVA
jgi:eukaryotic-like serine/threonine-protein kinase